MNTEYTAKYFKTRNEWRAWLSQNFETEKEIWFIFPRKSSPEEAVSYNDAVEEALCFGWIDSTAKTLDPEHRIQRFTPRRAKSAYSQPNKERLKWLMANNMIHPKLEKDIKKLLAEPFKFPPDIINRIKMDKTAWKNYQLFSGPYKRIRIAYIDGARDRPGEFERRLNNFIVKTRENKIISGYGGVEKYY